jgi:hypothetical protein
MKRCRRRDKESIFAFLVQWLEFVTSSDPLGTCYDRVTRSIRVEGSAKRFTATRSPFSLQPGRTSIDDWSLKLDDASQSELQKHTKEGTQMIIAIFVLRSQH